MPAFPLLSADLPADTGRAELVRRLVGLFGLLLVAATWRLWTPQQDFPQVPLVRAALAAPAALQWLPFVAMLAGLAGMLVTPPGRWARFALLLFSAGTLSLILFDQMRLQPWAYQFVIAALVLASCPARPAIGLLRLFIVGFYFHSALTKLDYSFLHTLGQQFLGTLAGFAGISLDDWSPSARLAAAAVFLVAELLVAIGLLLPPTRRFALCGSIALHLALLAILGPWGLDHRLGVLVWNLYFIFQNLILFWVSRSTVAAGPSEPSSPAVDRAPWPAAALVIAAIVLPFLEPWNLFDIWPSWGLYASSAERVVLQVHRRGEADLPTALASFIETPQDPAAPWLTVRLDRWALAALGAPIYPQARVQLGVALAVADAAGLAERARIIRFGRADRWTGEREHTIFQGTAQAQAAAGEYLLNAQPRRNLR
jgi:hypothetical protein